MKKEIKKTEKKEKKAVNLDGTIYNVSGKSAGSIKLSEDIFGQTWNSDLVHQVVTSMMTDARKPFAHTKTRGEVRGGGKKPWQQKGTGRARHGSSRSPIWVGGGVAHGPRNDKNFSRKVNKKMKFKALCVILSRKWRDGEILFVDKLDVAEPKTKSAVSVVSKLATVSGFERLLTKSSNSALVAVNEASANVKRGFGNLSNMEVSEIRNINPLSLLKYKFLILSEPQVAEKLLEAKMK
jgi:large subunit ribosomal protein L4